MVYGAAAAAADTYAVAVVSRDKRQIHICILPFNTLDFYSDCGVIINSSVTQLHILVFDAPCIGTAHYALASIYLTFQFRIVIT